VTRRSEQLTPELQEYLLAHSTPPDPVLQELAEVTAQRYPDDIELQIGPEQGMFMTLLTQVMSARRAVEVGTFTGYSAFRQLHSLYAG
jgi:caffeoyl-CoA O-methyltransferase